MQIIPKREEVESDVEREGNIERSAQLRLVANHEAEDERKSDQCAQ